jgi:CCR4-NOT transcriptional regulation complex NOT5 subunit
MSVGKQLVDLHKELKTWKIQELENCIEYQRKHISRLDEEIARLKSKFNYNPLDDSDNEVEYLVKILSPDDHRAQVVPKGEDLSYLIPQ